MTLSRDKLCLYRSESDDPVFTNLRSMTRTTKAIYYLLYLLLPLLIVGYARAEQPEGSKSYAQLSQDERSYVNTLVWKAANKLFGTAKSDIRIIPYNLNPDTMQADGKQYIALAFPVKEPIMSDMSKGYDLKNILNGSSITYTSEGRSKKLRIEEAIVQAIDFAAKRETNDAGVEKFIPARREYLVFPVKVTVRTSDDESFVNSKEDFNKFTSIDGGYFAKGAAAYVKGDFDNARIYFEKSFNICVEKQYQECIATSIGMVGMVFQQMGKRSERNFHERKKLKDRSGMRQAYDAAINYYGKAFAIFQTAKNGRAMVDTLFYLGRIANDHGEKEFAREILQKRAILRKQYNICTRAEPCE